MKKTRYKACLLISELDDDMILDAELSDVSVRVRKCRSQRVMKRILILAACVTMLAVAVTSVFLSAMLFNTGIHTDPSNPKKASSLDVEWVEDPNIIQVQRLSIGQSLGTGIVSPTTGAAVSVETARCWGQRLILLSFHCREGETITVTPGADGALFEAVQIEINQNLYWSVWDKANRRYVVADEFLNVSTEEAISCLGRSVSITEDTVLLWQYPAVSRPCVEDNFVDFTVTDSEGNITGGGSIYIGGLDLTTISENKTYYGSGHYGLNKVYLNASYRPVLLGAYRYAENEKVDASAHEKRLSELHLQAQKARESLFDDLTDDYFRLSYRVLLHKYLNDTDRGIFTSTIHHDVSYDQYSYVEIGKDNKRLFFLYNGTCQPITEWEIYTTDEYGYTVTGKLTLEDGTVVMVDINNLECMYEIILPSE